MKKTRQFEILFSERRMSIMHICKMSSIAMKRQPTDTAESDLETR